MVVVSGGTFLNCRFKQKGNNINNMEKELSEMKQKESVRDREKGRGRHIHCETQRDTERHSETQRNTERNRETRRDTK